MNSEALLNILNELIVRGFNPSQVKLIKSLMETSEDIGIGLSSKIIEAQNLYIKFLENHLNQSIRDSGNLNYMNFDAVKQGEEFRNKIETLTDKLI